MKLQILNESLMTESFKDVKNIFLTQADQATVNFYMDTFRRLNNEHRLSGEEKDITSWTKKGFNAFKTFVKNKSQEPSKKQIKVANKGNVKKVAEFPSYNVIIPLDKESSCAYGSGTRWCTASRNDNHFDAFFHRNGITLFYFLPKNGKEKFAIAYDRYNSEIDTCYDASDNTINIDEIERITKIRNLENLLPQWAEGISSPSDQMNPVDRVAGSNNPEEVASFIKDNQAKLSPEDNNRLADIVLKDLQVAIYYVMHYDPNLDTVLGKKVGDHFMKILNSGKQLSGDDLYDLLDLKSKVTNKNFIKAVIAYNTRHTV